MQAYNPRLQQWSVEEPLTNPKHKACAVAIDNSLVITGGTMLGKKINLIIACRNRNVGILEQITG